MKSTDAVLIFEVFVTAFLLGAASTAVWLWYQIVSGKRTVRPRAEDQEQP